MSRNNNKDPIEHFFQEKFRDHDIDYKKEDWERLEKRLDARDKAYAMQSRKRWMIAATVLLFSLLGYFIYENSMEINDLYHQYTSENQHMPQQTVQNPKGKAPSTNQKPFQKNTGAQTHQSQPYPKASSLASGHTKKQETSKVKNQAREPGVNNQAAVDRSKNRKPEQIVRVSELPCPTCNLPERISDQQMFASLHFEQKKPRKINKEARLSGGKSDHPATPTSNSANRTAISQRSSSLKVGLVTSPVMSSVGSISDFDNPGYQLGVTLEYSLSSNLDIRTGIAHSNVNYSARGREFSPYPGYWKGKTVPPETYAKCTLLDIPVSLKYNFLKFSKSRLYATVGISSYIMLNENYRYEYRSAQSGRQKGWSGNTGTRHLLSNADLSIGYEFMIGSNVSLRVEPYLQIPLKGVGWGHVKLYSMGSMVSINYSLW